MLRTSRRGAGASSPTCPSVARWSPRERDVAERIGKRVTGAPALPTRRCAPCQPRHPWPTSGGPSRLHDRRCRMALINQDEVTTEALLTLFRRAFLTADVDED